MRFVNVQKKTALPSFNNWFFYIIKMIFVATPVHIDLRIIKNQSY